MTKEQLHKLIAQGEGQQLEFKKSVAELDRVIHTLTAFANTNSNGGCVLIGVGDKGKLKEMIIGKETVKQIANKIADHTDPVLYPEIEVVKESGDKGIIVITIDGSPNKPHLAFGRAYKRVGSTTTQMTRDEYERMLLAKHESKFQFDSQICKGATLDDVDEERIGWFMDERKRKRNVAKPKDMDLAELLINIGAAKKTSGEVKPTNAGVLFFGKNPQRFFVNSGLRVVRFKGIEVIHPVIDRVDCSGTLWEMIGVAEEFIRRNIRLLSFRVSTSFKRDDKFEYPIDALREAMTNALIHRNYLEPADTRAFLFDDRVEVINPGTFPEGVTPEHPIHKPVNPVLCSFVYDIGFIEKYGSGIKMINRLCQRWGNPKPCYKLHPIETKIIFESQVKEPTYIEVADISDKLNERQKKTLYFAQKKEAITRKEYMEINKISHKTAHKELSDMTKKGFLVKEGKGRGVKYVLIKQG